MLPRETASTTSRLVLPAAVVALLCTTVLSLAYLIRQKSHIRELQTERDRINATLNQMREQMRGLEQKVDALTGIQQQAGREAAVAAQLEAVPATYGRKRRNFASRKAVSRRNEDEQHWMILESHLSDQQKQIAGTREEMDKARAEMQGRLDSARDDLNGSIAKTHDELVELQKHGERSYYEFTLNPSKQFQRVGSIGISLRNVNVKHKYYDLAMMVDDIKLAKKHVNLFEPVWINLADRPQPVQLVVNRIGKNEVRGYISEPKYKKPDLAAPTPKTEALRTR